MKRTRHPLVLITALLVLLGAGWAAAGPALAGTRTAPLRPIIFVHGFSGSGMQFETQAKRFASNGYPARYVATVEYDSLLLNTNAVYAAIDQRVAQLKAATGARKVDLAGHSLGTVLCMNYLNSSAARAANVAHYVNIDGGTATALPGGVPTLALWGEGNDTKAVTGALNLHAPNESHVQTTTSVHTFTAMYQFFTGHRPRTTRVVPQVGRIQLAGRAVNFPSNSGIQNARLDVYTVNPATGARTRARPVATFQFGAGGDGTFGPFPGSGTAWYEFAITKGNQVHHLYFEPFRRTDLGIRLLTTDPGTGIDTLWERNAAHVNLLVYRNKEWWGDQGAANDKLTVNGTNILNASITPRAKRAIGILAFDAKSDKVSHPTMVPSPLISLVPFVTGVDLYIPSSGRVVLNTVQRAGNGRPDRVVVPAWPSDRNIVTVNLNDYV